MIWMAEQKEWMMRETEYIYRKIKKESDEW